MGIAVKNRTDQNGASWSGGPLLLRAAAGLLVKAGNSILDAFRTFLFSKTHPRQPRTVFVVRFGAIGDFVVALPALRLLRRHFINARIVLLSATSLKSGQPLATVSGADLVGSRLVDEKIVLRGPALSNWRQLRRTQAMIRRLNPDLCIFLPFSGEPFCGRLAKILFLRLLGIHSNLYGYHTGASLGFLRGVQYDAGLYNHQLAATLLAIREVGITDEEVSFEVQTSPEDIAQVEEWWIQYGLNKCEPPIAICFTSKEEVKCWPLDNFLDVGLRLLKDPRLRIVLVGGKEDTQQASILLKAWGVRAISFTGKATILQTAEILRRCKLFVGVDSGPMHLAAALGRPVVGIFASVVFPVLWKPWGEQSLQLRHSVPCEFCFASSGICPTGTMECIRGIRVADVLEAVQVMLWEKCASQALPMLPEHSPLGIRARRS